MSAARSATTADHLSNAAGSLPTIELALEKGAAVLLLSHLGRPVEGDPDPKFSMQPVADRMAELLGRPVRLEKDWLDGVEIDPGEIVLCENVRFNAGEKKDDEALARAYAALCDIYVMDAFGTAHRAQASTHGVARFAPIACAGPLLVRELEALEARMAELEEERESLELTLADPSFYSGGASDLRETATRFEKVKAELEETFQRWAELEERRG